MLDKIKEMGWEIFHSAKPLPQEKGSRVFIDTEEEQGLTGGLSWTVRAYHAGKNIYWGSFDECSEVPSDSEVCDTCLETLLELSETLGITEEEETRASVEVTVFELLERSLLAPNEFYESSSYGLAYDKGDLFVFSGGDYVSDYVHLMHLDTCSHVVVTSEQLELCFYRVHLRDQD